MEQKIDPEQWKKDHPLISQEEFDKMCYRERCKLRKEHPETYADLVDNKKSR
jgi:NAD-dependent DNA ligase